MITKEIKYFEKGCDCFVFSACLKRFHFLPFQFSICFHFFQEKIDRSVIFQKIVLENLDKQIQPQPKKGINQLASEIPLKQ